MKPTIKTSLGLVLLLVIAAAMGSLTYPQGGQESSGQDLKGLIPWRSDMDSARRDAIAAKKPLLVEFVASWCPDCHEMARQSWTQTSIASAVRAFVPVLIDVDAQPELTRQYNVAAIPSLFVVDPKTGTITREVRDRVLSPEELLAWLK
ncbi:MAG: thioredoxin family protein [Tepidisphaeraceae bacterium]|jgi:thiol:disulfide interchange protein